MCLTTFSFRSCHHNECILPYRRHAAKRLLHLRRTRRTESHRALLCSVWSFAQFLLQPDQRKENTFLFQVFPPVIAGKSQTHPLPDRKSFTENDISAVFLNIRFQNGELTVTTGISYRIFSTDKTLEHEWDTLLKRFLTKNQISFDEL